jgi:hypothetical protein
MATSGLSLLICVTAWVAGHPTTSGHDVFWLLILSLPPSGDQSSTDSEQVLASARLC